MYIYTCIINKTSTRDSVGRVFGSRGFAGTANAAFKDSPATALVVHGCLEVLAFMGCQHNCMGCEEITERDLPCFYA